MKKYSFYSLLGVALLLVSTLSPITVLASGNEKSYEDLQFEEIFEMVYNHPNSKVEQLDKVNEDLSTITLEIDDIGLDYLKEVGNETNEENHSKTVISIMMDENKNISTFGSGSLEDSQNHSYGAVIGTVNYVTKSIKNVTHYGITSISGKFISAPGVTFSNRKVNAGQVGKNQTQNVNKTKNFTPTSNPIQTYILNWTADSLLVAQGTSTVGMNIETQAKKGSSTTTIRKSVTVINH